MFFHEFVSQLSGEKENSRVVVRTGIGDFEVTNAVKCVDGTVALLIQEGPQTAAPVPKPVEARPFNAERIIERLRQGNHVPAKMREQAAKELGITPQSRWV